MGRQAGFDHPPVYPVPESLESVGATYQLLGDRYQRRGDTTMARAYFRAAKAHWKAAQTMRDETKRDG
jgi:hypothetical protein